MNEFPYELRKAIEGLSNQHRQEILLALREKGKLSFSEINEEVPIKRPLLAIHLKKLSRTLLVEHFYQHQLRDEKYSYYRISPFGRALLESMLGTLFFKRVTTKITFPQIEREETTAAIGSVLKPNAKTHVSGVSSIEREHPIHVTE